MSTERTWDDLSYMKISLRRSLNRWSLIVDLNKFHSRNAIVPRIVSVHPCTVSTYISVRKRLSLVTYKRKRQHRWYLKKVENLLVTFIFFLFPCLLLPPRTPFGTRLRDSTRIYAYVCIYLSHSWLSRGGWPGRGEEEKRRDIDRGRGASNHRIRGKSFYMFMK